MGKGERKKKPANLFLPFWLSFSQYMFVALSPPTHLVEPPPRFSLWYFFLLLLFYFFICSSSMSECDYFGSIFLSRFFFILLTVVPLSIRFSYLILRRALFDTLRLRNSDVAIRFNMTPIENGRGGGGGGETPKEMTIIIRGE